MNIQSLFLKFKNVLDKGYTLKRIINEIDNISEVLNTLPLEDKQKLTIPIMDIIEDISKVASKNEIKKEVVTMLETRAKTYGETMRDKWIDEGFGKGAEEERKQIIKNLLKADYSPENIAKACGIDTEYIMKIKNEMN